MGLRLQIISRHRQGLGDRGSMEFGHNGGTIGRSLESDWVLPDGQRYLSSRHASIDFRSGSYYVVDTSTNGVYVNDAEQPVGRGNPQRLFTGDRLRIGEYEMSVEIQELEDTRETLANDKHVDPVSRAQRVPPPDPTRADMVAPHEITAVGIEMLIDEDAEIRQIQRHNKANVASLRLEEDVAPPTPKVAPPQPPPAAKQTEPEPVAAAPKRPEPPPVSAAARVVHRPAAPASTPKPHINLSAPAKPAQPPAPPTPAAPAPSLEAFFRGAGLPAQRLDDKQAEQVLHRLGQLMREVVLGVTENLHLRAEQKNVLRVPTTTIQPQNNNPLKFSASVEEALNNLLFRDSAEYLSAVDAVRETFADIKQHQQHLLSALRTAVVDYVGRLDPDELENKISNGKHGLLNAANKLKYWDLFKDLYQVVSTHQPGQFPPQFLEELARAYELEESRTASPAASRQTKLG
ncbi:MAG TPA: type VI secretion system-associated FHA domain protein TagH [Gammaproteobacteria bacterium]|nr:type VI secretion system-associated FHA domain protein TagH [Gammaproteobacteria bacterium]